MLSDVENVILVFFCFCVVFDIERSSILVIAHSIEWCWKLNENLLEDVEEQPRNQMKKFIYVEGPGLIAPLGARRKLDDCTRATRLF